MVRSLVWEHGKLTSTFPGRRASPYRGSSVTGKEYNDQFHHYHKYGRWYASERSSVIPESGTVCKDVELSEEGDWERLGKIRYIPDDAMITIDEDGRVMFRRLCLNKN